MILKRIAAITAVTAAVAVAVGAVLAATVASPDVESTPAATARESYLWGLGDATLLFVVFMGCVGLLAWRAVRMRRNEYVNVHGSLDGYTDYYAGALLSSVSHSVNR